MSKSSSISILTLLLIFMSPLPGLALEVDYEEINLLTDSFIEKLNSAFPAVELFVVGTSPNSGGSPPYKISLEPSTKVKIFQGMEFDLFRRGKPYKHPVTGVTLGYFNRKLGVARIKRLESSGSLECYPLPPLPEKKIKAGDLARITSKTIPVSVLLTGRSDHSSLMDELLFKIKNQGRFQVFSPEKVEDQKTSISENTGSPAKVRNYCSKMGVKALVIWKVWKKDNLVSRITVFSGISGKPMLKFFLSI